ncbi:MAG: hypothetical protein ACREFQ_01510, partial [Stellaceae bacterium]
MDPARMSSGSAPNQASGLAFIGCEMMTAMAPPPAAAQGTGATQSTARGPAPARRREVVVSGKRVKTVDVHAHCSVPEAMSLVSAPLPGPQQLLFARVEDRISTMDAQGIDVEALSI